MVTPVMSVEDVLAGVRLARALPAFLERPLRVDEARAILERRFANRSCEFLTLVRDGVYGRSTSPYRALLDAAGCEYGDLDGLVMREGLEPALRTLHRAGVYLTVDELKGRCPVRRGSVTIAVDPGRLRSSGGSHHLSRASSGSRGQRRPVPIDLAFLRDRAVDTCLFLDARGGTDWVHGDWGVPGGNAILHLLELAHLGNPPVRWFSQLDPGDAALHPRYRWSTRVVRWASRLAGVRLPPPEHVPPDEPGPIVRWMSDELRRGRKPHIITFASSAVRVCEAAVRMGVDLGGAHFTLGGEPLTPVRRTAIRRAGAEPATWYGSAESGIIALACLAPRTSDDAHVLHDRFVLVQPGEPRREGLRPDALFITSIRRSSGPLLLLNVSLGDTGTIIDRACGCPLEHLGWGMHLHTIRSHEKLTGAGMTFSDTEVIRVLEEVLPGRYGGGPTDYQLVDGESRDGGPTLRLLMHPRLGEVDEPAVVETFLSAIGAGSGVERVMALVWRQAGLPRVERRPPYATTSGKILHLFLDRNGQAEEP